jgi:probable HAF family extracellular repeat protein
MKKLFLFTLLAAALALGAHSQSAPYQLVDLGTLPGHLGSGAFDINNRGQIVGFSGPWNGGHAVLWEDGTIIDLGTLYPGDYSYANAINERGQIVGVSTGEYARAVLWENGTITELAMLPGDDSSGAAAINELGQIVGTGSRGFEHHGLLWDNGTITVLEGLDIANDINERGQVVGFNITSTSVHAVLWENGTITDLGTLPGHNYSVAFSINNRGQVMGHSGMWDDDCHAGECNAVLWENGTIRDLGIPLSEGGGINERGQIVFASVQEYFPGDSFVRPVLWDKGTITDLGELAAPGSGLGVAWGNNDRGQIVGWAVDAGDGHAALWTR